LGLLAVELLTPALGRGEPGTLVEPTVVSLPAGVTGAWCGGSAGRHASAPSQAPGDGVGGVRHGDSLLHTRAS
jgi:hypothetical protein